MDRLRIRMFALALIVGASVVVLLRMGFWMAGQPPPTAIVAPFYIAAALLFVIAVAVFTVAMRNRLLRPGPSQKNHPQSASPALPVNRDTLCVHLQPIEIAMRASGIHTPQLRGCGPQANCQIDHVALKRDFGPTVAALYVERHDIDRSYLDPKSALLHCVACNSTLWVVHAEAASETTPWFPHTLQHSRANAELAAS